MSATIYIAAPFIRQLEARQKADELNSMGFTVTSHWIYEEDSLISEESENIAISAHRSIKDIDAAQYFLLLADHDSRTGGKHFETGYAYATGKNLMIVGRRENVFHHLPRLIFAQTWEEAKGRLERVIEAIEDKPAPSVAERTEP